MTTKLVFCTATELAGMIDKREVSAVEVAEAFLAQIAEHNPKLNAIVTLDADGVHRRAAEADAALASGEKWGPLHGVPTTFKDVFETAGMRTTSGHKPLADHIPQRDATVVARMRAAGAIILGKTNTPDLAGDIQCNSPLLGRGNNPWNPDRTPGGSSGGEAAAVAAGLSPLGFGSDLGGSIRLPAHYCGVFGLKPTIHRIPLTGHIPPPPGKPQVAAALGTVGPIARSVADLRLAFSLTAGPDGQDMDVPPVPLADVPKRPLSSLRFAWTDDFGGLPVTQDTRAAFARLAEDLSKAGCRVERAVPPDFDFVAAWETSGKFTGCIAGFGLPAGARLVFGLFGPMIFKDPMMGSAVKVLALKVQSYYEALMERERFSAQVERFLADYDAWLCPAASIPAFPHCKPGPVGEPLDVDGQKVAYWMASCGYTTLFNLTGHPVVTMPLVQSKEDLPIGMQVVGRLWDEMALLNTAEALADVTGPLRHPPGY